MILCSSISSEHEFHISKTTINYKEDQQALQITLHTFIDDMEVALKSYDDLEYRLLHEKEHVATDSVLNVYFRDHLKINLDGAPVSFEYIGKEMSDDLMGLWGYLEVSGVSSFKTIEITNSLLMDTYEDQKNIIMVKVNGKSEAHHILSSDDRMRTITL